MKPRIIDEFDQNSQTATWSIDANPASSSLEKITLQLSGKMKVFDADNTQEIEGIYKQEFVFTVPYRVGAKVTLPFYEGYFRRGPFYLIDTMDESQATSLTQTGLMENQKAICVGVNSVRVALFDSPQPAKRGDPLNAFETKGWIYRLNE